MKKMLKFDYYMEEREKKLLIIFPEKPFWLVGDISYKVILEYFKGNITYEQLQEELKESYGYDLEEQEKIIGAILELFEEAKLFEEEIESDKEYRKFENYFPNPVINVTRKCNLKCKHCYAEAGDIWNEKELLTEEIKEVID